MSISFVIGSIVLLLNYFEAQSYRERMSMLELGSDLKVGDFVGEAYFGKGFYCVWTKGVIDSEVEEMQDHGACHALVAENTVHFCK